VETSSIHISKYEELIKTFSARLLRVCCGRDGVRKAQGRTGIGAADFSRIRNTDFARFTADRLVAIINRLGSRIEVAVKVRRVEANRQAPAV
jgi:hypothetical protein